MPKLKSKSAAAPAAQSREEAERLVHRIGEIQRELARREADLGDMVARVKSEAEKAALPLKEELAEAHEAVQAWSEANRAALTRDGKTKTVELATGRVFWRLRPPSVRIRGVDAVIRWLQNSPGGEGFGAFLSYDVSIDKSAMLRDPATAARVPGVTVGSAGEDFIVEPFEAQLVESRA